jgi:hypothetical protein
VSSEKDRAVADERADPQLHHAQRPDLPSGAERVIVSRIFGLPDSFNALDRLINRAGIQVVYTCVSWITVSGDARRHLFLRKLPGGNRMARPATQWFTTSRRLLITSSGIVMISVIAALSGVRGPEHYVFREGVDPTCVPYR